MLSQVTDALFSDHQIRGEFDDLVANLLDVGFLHFQDLREIILFHDFNVSLTFTFLVL